MNTPAQNLLEKLILQQESANFVAPSPLLLFEYSNNVGLRVTAASGAATGNATQPNPRSRAQQQQQQQQAKAQDEADLYRRAQLRTPAEDAQRLVFGGPLLFEYLSKEILKQKLAASKDTNPQKSQRPSLVWIATTTRDPPSWLMENPNQVSIVDMSDIYCSFFDFDDDTDGDSGADEGKPHPLEAVFEQIKTIVEENQSSSTPIVLESSTPLVQLYGFSPVLQFIKKLQQSTPRSILLVPAVTESMTAPQHQKLEDLAHTVFWLSNHTGQVEWHVLRRGIREQDSTVREVWEFHLVAEHRKELQHLHPLRVVVGSSDAKEDDEDEAPDQVNLLEAMNPVLNPEAKPPPVVPDVEDSVSQVTARTKKITLKLEEDNIAKVAAPSEQKPAHAAATAPRIFLQDDDPEFEDYDEEDPDDDLDI